MKTRYASAKPRLCYIDIRPRAPNAVFDLDTVGPGYVRLENIKTRFTFIESRESFVRNYEPIPW